MNDKINNSMKDPMNKSRSIPEVFRFILLSVLIILSWTVYSTYSTLTNEKELIKLATIANNFVKIPSKIDKLKLKAAYADDPIKLIYDPNYSYLGKVNGSINQITLFIEFNPFSKKCEMTSRVSGIWKFLDNLSEKGPFYLNLKSFEINNDYCNKIYGYGKIN